jgi:hypothetical protein
VSLTAATKQVPVPGSGPNAPTSVYQDITQGLEKVGKGAFGLIPQGIKDALNTEAPVDKGKQPMGSPPKARRSSVGGEWHPAFGVGKRGPDGSLLRERQAPGGTDYTRRARRSEGRWA